MATKYSDIFEKAIFYFKDYDYLKFSDDDKEYILEKYLISAKVEIEKSRVVKINRDEENKELTMTINNETTALSDECIEMLSLGIAYYWLNSQTLNSRLLRNNISTKEYSYFSPANLLKEITNLRDTVRNEFREKIIEFSYNYGGLAELNVGG